MIQYGNPKDTSVSNECGDVGPCRDSTRVLLVETTLRRMELCRVWFIAQQHLQALLHSLSGFSESRVVDAIGANEDSSLSG